ncbi:MAG: PEGA domain-containing protein [Deltaproteobacteria bacterium]|nr:PEGA domain-containing protein [Deltaproteobacteria bacterium]
MKYPRAVSLLCTLTTALVLALAAAAPLTASAQSRGREAAKVIERALHDARSRDYGGAVAGFKRAWELTRDPAHLFNIATLYLRRLNDPESAWKYALEYRDLATTGDGKREARALVRDIEAALRKTHGKIVVKVEPPTADLYLDSKEAGGRMSSGVVWAMPGRHAVLAEAPGYRPSSTAVKVRRGVETSVTLVLRPEKAFLEVISDIPGYACILDDEPVGVTPLRRVVEPGPHRIRVESRGHRPYEQKIDLSPGETLVVRADLASADLRQSAPPKDASDARAMSAGRIGSWVAMGTGSAMVVTGAVLYGLAWRDYKDADNLQPGPNYDADFDARVSVGRKKAYASYGLLGAGAAALGVGLILYFVLPAEQTVTIGPGGLPGPSLAAHIRW